MPLSQNAGVAQVDDAARDADVLSPAYREALRLDAEGFGAAVIADVLDIPAESVPLLLDLARRKLYRRIAAKHAKG